MRQLLNVSQIKKKYPNQWILLVDPVYDRLQTVTSGIPIFHAKDADAVKKKALKLGLPRIALLHTKGLPKDRALIL